MPLRTMRCIDPRCTVQIPFSSVDELRRKGVKILERLWAYPEPIIDLGLCTHQTSTDPRDGFFSDLLVITRTAPADVMARGKLGILRHRDGTPVLEKEDPDLFYVPDELAHFRIPMVYEPELHRAIPKRSTVELPHMSALTDLRYSTLRELLEEIPGRITTTRVVRYDTREFVKWWVAQQDPGATF